MHLKLLNKIEAGLPPAAIGCCIALPADVSRAACPPLAVSNPQTVERSVAGFVQTGRRKQVAPPFRHRPVPEGELDSVRIKLERTECYGSCPSYSIELKGDGSAFYTGKAFVLVFGTHTFEVPKEDIQCLLTHFREADFWSLKNGYFADVTDNPTTRVTLEIDGRARTVTDYVGLWVGMPEAVTALEEEIDRIGEIKRWTLGDSETIPTLRREHFDFQSDAGAAILANAVVFSSDELVLNLLAEGAPATGRFSAHLPPSSLFKGPTAVQAASASGRLTIVQALISKGAFSSNELGVKEAALRAGASLGNPAIIAEILKYDPNVNAQDSNGNTALMSIQRIGQVTNEKIKTGRAAIARLLLAAGADPNLQNKQGITALHRAYDADVVQLLVKAGAKLETEDMLGRTPLLTAISDDAAMALIVAGADITAKDNRGGTVENYATLLKFTKTLALLQSRQN